MRVLVDLDGVVADWGFGYNRYRVDPMPRYEERATWDLNAGLSAGLRSHTKMIMEHPGFYRDLPVIEGAKEAISSLRAWGHDVRFVSTPYATNESCASDKFAWVEEHFGQSMRLMTTLTFDKTLVRGDVLIDDKPLIGGTEPPEWKHLCFGDYGYSNTTESQRVKNWEEALEAITLLAWEKELTS